MARLILMVDGVGVNQFDLDIGDLTMGRSPENDVPIDDLAVSGQHAVIEMVKDENFSSHITYWIRDLDSTNKTYVNDVPVSHQRLHNNDIVKIGWNQFKFVDENEIDTEKTDYILQSTQTQKTQNLPR